MQPYGSVNRHPGRLLAGRIGENEFNHRPSSSRVPPIDSRFQMLQSPARIPGRNQLDHEARTVPLPADSIPGCDVEWLPGGCTRTLTNVGESPARFVTLGS